MTVHPARDRPHCVIDTRVIVYANSPVKKHVSTDQKDRWRLLGRVVALKVVVVKSKKLQHEYVQKLKGKGKERSDVVKAFIKALDSHGLPNEQSLTRQDRARYGECRFPAHDDVLLKTAKGIDGVVVAAEEQAHLKAADCIKRKLKIRILTPGDALDHWDL